LVVVVVEVFQPSSARFTRRQGGESSSVSDDRREGLMRGLREEQEEGRADRTSLRECERCSNFCGDGGASSSSSSS
jgi:hypothetical protein